MKSVLTPLRVLLAICVVSMGAGCATNSVQYGDATSTQALSTDFGSADLQQTAASMVDSLLAFPPVVEVTSQRRPILTVDKVKNKTMQHIDTEAVTDTIRAKMIQSGKFRFVDRTTDQATIAEIKAQQEGGLVNPDTAVQFGQQFGAEYILTANLSQITQREGKITDVYYKFTMNLKSLKTGIVEWSDEKEIRKIRKRPTFGM